MNESRIKETASHDKTVLRIKEVCAKTRLSKSTIYKYIDKGIFPKGFPLGYRAVGWFIGDIDDWLNTRAGFRPDFVKPVK